MGHMILHWIFWWRRWSDIDNVEQLGEWLCVLEAKLRTDVDHFPLGLEPIPHAQHAVALAEQYLNARQQKLGTATFSFCILQHDGVDTGLLPERNICMANSTYSLKNWPGSGTLTPLYRYQ